MLRSFLEKEFKITSHQEQRPTSVYALVVGKNGPQLQRSAEPGDHLCKHIDGGTTDPDAKGVPSDQGGFVCTKMTMAEFADFLPELAPGYLDRFVVNSTGLEGAFDFKLTWVPRATIEQGGGITAFDALEKELGLKLEGRRLPITVTVIDHIEKLADDTN